jgi:putative MATE family efflux protein
MLGGAFSVIAFNLVDTFYISQLGTLPLAAMGYTFPVTTVLGSISMGLGTGASSVVSRLVGEQQSKASTLTADPEAQIQPADNVRAVATHTLILGFMIAIIFAVMGLLTIEPVFTALGADEKTLPLITQYMQWWYLGIACLIVPMAGNSMIRATGDTVTPSLIMILIAGLNAILDPILIFGAFGIPALGIAGAAIATVISRFITLVASLWVLSNRLHLIGWVNMTVTGILDSFTRVLSIGLPAIATNLILPLGGAIITRMISEYGHAAIASFGVVAKLESFGFIPMIALATSLSAFVGQNFGAQKYDRVFSAIKISATFSMCYGVLMAAPMWIWGETIISWFDTNPDVIKTGYLFFVWVGWSYGLEGIIWLINTTFNAMGKPKYPIIFATLRVVGIYAHLGYWLGQHYQVAGIFAAIGLANLIVAILGVLTMRKTKQQCDKKMQTLNTDNPTLLQSSPV